MKWKAAVEKNLQWFYSSGVMVPENGLWGAAERLAVKNGNQALNEILESFPAWSDREECYVIEQRRADCNFQIAWLFLLADRAFPGCGYGETGVNILDFLYFRSGLLERQKNASVPGNWNWSHIKRESVVYFDDEAWCIFIQLRIADEFPELDQRYHMRYWAETLAESLYCGATDPEKRPLWRGHLADPHWGALAAMALAQAAGNDTGKYRDFCLEYFQNVQCPNVSEYAYALLGAVNCALKFGKENFMPFVEKYAGELIAKSDPASGLLPAEHGRETPIGSNLADLIYTINWSSAGLRETGLLLHDKSAEVAAKQLSFLRKIQDTSESRTFRGCWRGMYDLDAAKWGGGDLFEGGANSIYTGWTNAPIALTMLFEHTKKSMFGNP